MKKITFLLVLMTYVSFAQTSYTFEIERDATNTNLFTVFAVPSADATGANFTSAVSVSLISTGKTIGNVTSLTGTLWEFEIIAGNLLQGAGVGDGTKDLLSVFNGGDNVVFDHIAGDRFGLVSFEVTSNTTVGDIEFIENDNAIIVGANALGFNFGNSMVINSEDGNGDGERFDTLVGNTLFSFESLSTEDFKLSQVSVYPNPIADSFNVKLANNTIDAAQILNINGALVKAIDPNTLQNAIDVNELQTGIYFLQLTSGNSKHTIKLIKQ